MKNLNIKIPALFLALPFLALFLVLSTQNVLSAGFDYTLETQYDIVAGEKATVKTIIEVTNNSDQRPPDLTLPVAGSSISDIVAEAQDGKTVRINLNDTGDALKIVQDSDFTGNGRKWSFSVTYKADLIERLGSVPAVQIPALDYKNLAINSHTIIVSSDLNLGTIINRGPKPAKNSVAIGRQVLEYQSTKGAFSKSLSYYFGESTVVQVAIEKEIRNESFWWKTVTVALPPDTNQQQVYIESIEPRPTNMRLDQDGNILAEYYLSPKRSITVSAKALLGIKNVDYALADSQPIAKADPQLVERYTQSNDFWRPLDKELEITAETSSAKAIEQIFNAVVGSTDESLVPSLDLSKPRSDTGSLAVADTLVGALRGRGIPARVVIGKVISDGNKILDTASGHAWVEAYVSGAGWITLDPVFAKSSDVFGVSDVMHIGLTLWGAEPDYPPVDIDDWKTLYLDQVFPEKAATESVVAATKHMIIPGVSVMSLSVTQSPGRIVDGAFAVSSHGQQEFSLGSLAPLQTVSTRTLRLGGSAFSSEEIKYANSASKDSITSVQSTTSYWPFLTILLAIASIFLVRFMVVKRRSRHQTTPSRESVIMHADKEGHAIEQEDLLAPIAGAIALGEHLPIAQEPMQQFADMDRTLEEDVQPQFSNQHESVGNEPQILNTYEATAPVSQQGPVQKVADSEMLPVMRKPATDMQMPRTRFNPRLRPTITPRRAQEKREKDALSSRDSKPLIQG